MAKMVKIKWGERGKEPAAAAVGCSLSYHDSDVNLGIISGLGIICGRGSFAALYSCKDTFKSKDACNKKYMKPKRKKYYL